MIILKLERQIERKRTQLNETINTKGIMDENTLKISQQLDVLIVMKMTGQLLN